MGTKNNIRKRRQYWQDKWKLANGCKLCGYNKNPRALSFDHLDRSEKHSVTKNGQSYHDEAKKTKMNGGGMWQLTHPKYSVKELVNEWRKCRILCMNCHMEERYKVTKPELTQLEIWQDENISS